MRRLVVVFAAMAALLMPLPGLATAHADDVFVVCQDGHSGIATALTSCPFAMNVRQAYLYQNGPVVVAYSPVTGDSYNMQCQSGFTANLNNGQLVSAVRCVGGNNAVVVLF